MKPELSILPTSNRLFQVPYWDVSSIFPRIKSFLDKAIAEQSDHTIESIYNELVNQRMQLWVLPWEMALVTQIQTYPASRKCVIILAGGSGLNGAEQEISVIETWAKSLACEAIEIVGRDGWGQIYPSYKKTATVFRRKL